MQEKLEESSKIEESPKLEENLIKSFDSLETVTRFNYLSWDNAIWTCSIETVSSSKVGYQFRHDPVGGGNWNLSTTIHYWNNRIEWESELTWYNNAEGHVVYYFEHSARRRDERRASQYIDFETKPGDRTLTRALLDTRGVLIDGFKVGPLP
jgi:hypothetical protein